MTRSAFKPCGSPEKLKKLKVGKHKVAVRAVDGPTAQADSSPATKKFKIKRKKPKRHHHHHCDAARGRALTTAIPSFHTGFAWMLARQGFCHHG